MYVKIFSALPPTVTTFAAGSMAHQFATSSSFGITQPLCFIPTQPCPATCQRQLSPTQVDHKQHRSLKFLSLEHNKDEFDWLVMKDFCFCLCIHPPLIRCFLATSSTSQFTPFQHPNSPPRTGRRSICRVLDETMETPG